jgi:hypothetical protein
MQQRYVDPDGMGKRVEQVARSLGSERDSVCGGYWYPKP